MHDEKAYTETYTALGPLIDVARETGTHLMLSQHAGKARKAEAIDAPLGSTAIGHVFADTLYTLNCSIALPGFQQHPCGHSTLQYTDLGNTPCILMGQAGRSTFPLRIAIHVNVK